MLKRISHWACNILHIIFGNYAGKGGLLCGKLYHYILANLTIFYWVSEEHNPFFAVQEAITT